MRIYERTDYGLADIINQIKSDFGFVFVPVKENVGYILLGEKVKLNLEFNENSTLKSAKLSFPSNELDITDSTLKANLYSSSIESSLQVVALIDRMTSGNSDESDENEETTSTEVDGDENGLNKNNDEPRVQ